MRKCSKCKDHDMKCQASQITKPLRCAASLSCAFQAGILGFARHLAQCHAYKNAKDIALDNYWELKCSQLVTETFPLRPYFKCLSFKQSHTFLRVSGLVIDNGHGKEKGKQHGMPSGSGIIIWKTGSRLNLTPCAHLFYIFKCLSSLSSHNTISTWHELVIKSNTLSSSSSSTIDKSAQ